MSLRSKAKQPKRTQYDTNRELAALRKMVDDLRYDLGVADKQVEKLEAFKAYVHSRLDSAGVPADPEPESNAKHGCRIEGRLNWLLQRVAEASGYITRVRELRSGLETARGFVVRRDDAELVRDRRVLVDHVESVLWNDAKSAETTPAPNADARDERINGLDHAARRALGYEPQGTPPDLTNPSYGPTDLLLELTAENLALKSAVTLPASTVEKVRAAFACADGSHRHRPTCPGDNPNFNDSDFARCVHCGADLVALRLVRAALALLPPPTKESK